MKKVVMDRVAEITFNALDAEKTRWVEGWFQRLADWDKDDAVRASSIPLDKLPGVYLLQTTTEIRIFFRIEAETITVLDIANIRSILAFANGAAPGESEATMQPSFGTR